ncbi:cation:proton antiporter [Actinosynnema sp. NPDC023587]|uniref:cation:proton antiporter domain-containing protein n=1 Tax=Actinosynnema sp. NPDC023587 TaxID=3154695 RepID=UPI0033E7CB1D
MTTILGLTAIVLWSLTAHRLSRWHIGAPVVMVVAGVVLGFLVGDEVAAALNTLTAEFVAEIILAVLLFVDATEVRGGRLFGNHPGTAARLLLVALPLSLALAVGLGAVLLPDVPWPVLLVLACVVVPIDFAPAEQVVRDRGLSARVRTVLNIEGGYNDGIVTPVFLFAMTLAGDRHQERTPLEALATVLPSAVKALVVGLLVGAATGWLMDRCASAGWMTGRSRRILVLVVPLLTFFTTVAVGGNGFVASFVSGIAFRFAHRVFIARNVRAARQRGDTTEALARSGRDLNLLEDVSAQLGMTMWLVVGTCAVLVIGWGFSWAALLFCLAALTLIRAVPVLLALTGSPFTRRERLLVAALGPRGTTSIVFGLLAYNGLPDGVVADTILVVTVTCVLLSVVLHGLGAPLAHRFARGRAEPASRG